ncbi:hypothetical protein ASG01_11205 [Chryseobacterium sp. Leaf180]|uniref:carboxypeptidase-like regulatory domain-containing protein n=1 Tax=Chryseobacterium sp. Leaf180 TaxID=1736289 RepID=UPI000701AF2F|nr:carboxypeptidase-like regulatory domain-containing protein [Chryseobacterium sp. Leaf180]KQR92479.1 hypothetical protein ASG01_11205 [Chryseobacterium sp. Leaf180]
MKKSYLFILMSLSTLLINCGGEDMANIPQQTGTQAVQKGKVSGKIMSQNGSKAIGGASVFTFDEKYKIYHTVSDADGNFNLEAPAGNRTIYIQTGNGSNFRTQITADIKANDITQLNLTQTKLTQVAKIGYIKGSYDKIEDIITTLGYTATELTHADLANMNTLAQYDIVFLNCGSRKYSQNSLTMPVVENNLAIFVANGGSVYASDWDVSYLLGGGENTNNCNLAGGFVPDSKLCSKNLGNSGNLPATVNSTALSSALGFSTLNIDYDLGSWQKINTYDPAYWEVLVKSTATNEALMLRTNNFTATGLPNLPIGNASNLTFVPVCITLPNNIQITVSVPQATVPFLVALGATVGACSGNAGSGSIYYTTFHNHASGNIGNAGIILQYVILNL